MLNLTRKDGEVIAIGNDIRIIILESRTGRVRVGIEAPEGVKVLRGELAPSAAELAPDDWEA